MKHKTWNRVGRVLGASWFMFYVPFRASAKSIEIFDKPSSTLNFIGLANKFREVSDAAIPFLVGLSVVAILFGIYKYIVSAGDAERVAEGRVTIIYGVVALFVMLAFWGLVIAISSSLFG